jgi:hypothetical protein
MAMASSLALAIPAIGEIPAASWLRCGKLSLRRLLRLHCPGLHFAAAVAQNFVRVSNRLAVQIVRIFGEEANGVSKFM